MSSSKQSNREASNSESGFVDVKPKRVQAERMATNEEQAQNESAKPCIDRNALRGLSKATLTYDFLESNS